MNKFIKLATVLTLLVWSVSFAQTQAPTAAPPAPTETPVPDTSVPADWPDPAALEFSPVEYEAPVPTRHELSNGMVVYLLEDHTLPLINGAAYVKAGSFYDPEDQVGLASLTADLMRTGGAAGRSADELDETLESLAASVEVSAADLYTAASFSALRENIDEVLGVLEDVLTAPDFEQSRIEIARGRALEAIRRQNDDPVGIAVREFNRRLAEGHPAGYVPTEETVNNISREDMVAFYERYFKPNATVLALSGDFDSGAMLETLETTFSDWESAEVDYPTLPPYNPTPEPKVYVADRALGQSIIIMGHPSVFAYSPAYNDLTVANNILGGGGFSSRLFTDIRSNRGLAYSVGSQVGQGFETPGTLLLFSFTRTERTAEVVGLLLEGLERLESEPVSPEELTTQRDAILNQAIFRSTSPAAVVQRIALATEILGLPTGYYDDYIARVSAVTPEDVLSVAQQELRPEDMIILVVGDVSEFDAPLDQFGEVVPIELE